MYTDEQREYDKSLEPNVTSKFSRSAHRITRRNNMNEQQPVMASRDGLSQISEPSTSSNITEMTAPDHISLSQHKRYGYSATAYPTQSSGPIRKTFNLTDPPTYSAICNDRTSTNESSDDYRQIGVDRKHSTQIRPDKMETDTTAECGLIILGNSGVGKSFLANILLGREVFCHGVRSSSVTHNTDFMEMNIGNAAFAIFDIPGLIEADQRRIELNKREIDKAFSQRPDSIIIYVFGNQNGRIRDEDVVAFKAIDAAYSFKRESLVLVLNTLPKKRARDYEGTTLVLLQQLLSDTEINDGNVCFLNNIDPDDRAQKQFLKEQLLKVLVNFTPAVHQKTQEIQTLYDRLQTEMRRTREQQAKFEIDRDKYIKEIERNQKRLDQTIKEHRTETESYKKAMRRQEAMLQKQQEKFEKECEQHNCDLKDLRGKMNQAMKDYERLLTGDRISVEDLQKSHDAYTELKQSLDRLADRMPCQPPVKKRSHCVIS